jgi:hypothetical protein
MSFPLSRLAWAALLLSVPASAQVLHRASPAAFGPGALLRLDAALPGDARELTIMAQVGGELCLRRAPLLAGPEGERLALAPAFADEGGASPDGPWAWVAAGGAAQPVFLFEGAAGLVRTAGAGSQLAQGGRLSITFDLAGGPPSPGNAGFTLALLGAPPAAAAFAVVALPREAPWERLRDATLVPDLSRAVLVGPVAVDEDGTARVGLPVPALPGADLAVQWLVRDGARREPLVSDALRVAL